MPIKDETGNRYERLVVIARNGYLGKHAAWLCQCDCGEERTIRGSHLRNGSAMSCGCYRIERIKSANTRHGAHTTPEYYSWAGARSRCTNPKNKGYHRYGGRGIAMCAPWMADFRVFLRDMGLKPSPKHSLDRIDNNGPYSPENCRWATKVEQGNNRRDNVRITYGEFTYTLSQWAKRLGAPRGRIEQRIRYGWTDPGEILFGKSYHHNSSIIRN